MTQSDAFPHEDLVRKMEGIQNRYDAYDVLQEICLNTGFRYGAVVALPPERDQRLADHVLLSNWPAEFIRGYDETGLLTASPTFAIARRAVAPITWSWQEASRRRNKADEGRARDLFKGFGILNGVIIPVGTARGPRLTFCLLGERDLPVSGEIASLLLLMTHFAERLQVIFDDVDGEPPAKLSDRERQCLVWTSAGKTSTEIGAILGLSEHTVNQYITSCCQKLGAVNRAQAVAKAIRWALID